MGLGLWVFMVLVLLGLLVVALDVSSMAREVRTIRQLLERRNSGG